MHTSLLPAVQVFLNTSLKRQSVSILYLLVDIVLQINTLTKVTQENTTTNTKILPHKYSMEKNNFYKNTYSYHARSHKIADEYPWRKIKFRRSRNSWGLMATQVLTEDSNSPTGQLLCQGFELGFSRLEAPQRYPVHCRSLKTILLETRGTN